MKLKMEFEGSSLASRGLGGGGFYVGREDAEAFDAAIGGGDDFDAQAGVVEHHDFAAQGDAAFDFADQAAEGCGFELISISTGSPKRSTS